MKYNRPRHAFTLIETVISLSIMSTLFLGLSGAVMVASNAIPTATQTGIQDQQVVDALNMVRMDLRQSKKIFYETRAAGSKFTLTINDTGAAGAYKEVQYQYIISTKIFTRQVNGESEEVLFDSIAGITFQFTMDGSDVAVVWILIVVKDTIQPMFELNIVLPDKPELL